MTQNGNEHDELDSTRAQLGRLGRLAGDFCGDRGMRGDMNFRLLSLDQSMSRSQASLAAPRPVARLSASCV